jgi:hypothetical protein
MLQGKVHSIRAFCLTFPTTHSFIYNGLFGFLSLFQVASKGSWLADTHPKQCKAINQLSFQGGN